MELHVSNEGTPQEHLFKIIELSLYTHTHYIYIYKYISLNDVLKLLYSEYGTPRMEIYTSMIDHGALAMIMGPCGALQVGTP